MLCSVLSVLLLVYYVYAIIGMEIFHDTVHPGCWWVTFSILHFLKLQMTFLVSMLHMVWDHIIPPIVVKMVLMPIFTGWTTLIIYGAAMVSQLLTIHWYNVMLIIIVTLYEEMVVNNWFIQMVCMHLYAIRISSL